LKSCKMGSPGKSFSAMRLSWGISTLKTPLQGCKEALQIYTVFYTASPS
jgi:hypothetical protein